MAILIKDVRCKLTKKIVLEIRKKSQEGMSNAELARMFDISSMQVGKIIKRLSWKHI